MNTVVILSAYREPALEAQKREQMAMRLPDGPRLRPWGLHTYHEAQLVLQACPVGRELWIVTSSYHATRAFLTFVRVVHERQREHELLVRVRATDSGVRMNERRKIRECQAKGHCSTYAEACAYMDWWKLQLLHEGLTDALEDNPVNRT